MPRSSERFRFTRSEEHTSELQSQFHLVCRLLLEKKKILENLPDPPPGVPSILFTLIPLYRPPVTPFFFFFNDTATTEIYTLSLHDALPIYPHAGVGDLEHLPDQHRREREGEEDRKSTRLNSSHSSISYAVFCLKKKNK